MFRTLLALSLLAAGAIAVTPSATAWTNETCLGGGYNPSSLSNVCYKTGDALGPCIIYVIGNTCVQQVNTGAIAIGSDDMGAKVIVGPRNGPAYVEVSTGYYGLLCVQGSVTCVG